jgi:hypothetical protein
MRIPHHTKLHSNSFECKTPKFLKNRQSLLFQKLAGSGFASAIPISFLLKANWYQTCIRAVFTRRIPFPDQIGQVTLDVVA